MNKYEVPVDIYVTGTITVTARNAEEAKEFAQDYEARVEDHALPTQNTVLDFVTDATVTGLLALDAEVTRSDVRGYRNVRSSRPKVRVVGDDESTDNGGIKVRSRKLRR